MDILLHRYGSFESLYELDIHTFGRLLAKASEKREESKAWDMWLSLYPHMDESNFEPFSEYYSRITTPISIRPAEDILAEAAGIEAAIAAKRG